MDVTDGAGKSEENEAEMKQNKKKRQHLKYMPITWTKKTTNKNQVIQELVIFFRSSVKRPIKIQNTLPLIIGW